MHLEDVLFPGYTVLAAAWDNVDGDAHGSVLPAGWYGLLQEQYENVEHEKGNDEGEVESSLARQNAAYRCDEGIGYSCEEANEGVAFIYAEPGGNGPHEHGENDKADAEGHDPVDDGDRKTEHRITPAQCVLRQR